MKILNHKSADMTATGNTQTTTLLDDGCVRVSELQNVQCGQIERNAYFSSLDAYYDAVERGMGWNWTLWS